MLVRVITLRFNPLLEAFDDGPLRDFIADKDVISIRDHFFIRDQKPYLAMIVTYGQGATLPSSDQTPGQPQSKKDESWRELVSEPDIPLFNTLRDWRAERCKKEGIPPYVIVTNRLLAEIVKHRPTSLPQLGEIEGFGKAKLDRYGKDILMILGQNPSSVSSPSDAPSSEDQPEDTPNEPQSK